jgi:hypothetical protein
MKLYINVDKQPLNGYKNINLATDTIDLQNLNTICEQAEATEIILDNVLEYINFKNIDDFIFKIYTRLRLNGKMVINFVNLSMVIDDFTNGLLNCQGLNSILYGVGNIRKTSMSDSSKIESILQNLGLQIESIEINRYNNTIIAKRKK